jgi:alkanesulfonate monooxygenase SsuD/methylene tetrahydromethanopterin reductase-like flavin-dependent oxidoreductase (luciferase family)
VDPTTAPPSEIATLERDRTLGLSVGYPGNPLADALRLAQQAETAGFGLIGAGEGSSENFSLMGALATCTETIGLVTSITGWTRSPVTTALAASTVQELAGGRYRLGLGTMPREWSERWHGVDYDRPASRMRDFVAAIRTAWRSAPGQRVDHRGAFYSFAGYERLTRPAVAPPPLYLAATRARMARLAGEVADGVIFNLITSPAWVSDILLPAYAEGLTESRRDRASVDIGIPVYCAIADTLDQARDLARPALAFYFAVPYFADILRHHDFLCELETGYAAAGRGNRAGMIDAVSDAMIDTFALVGTGADVTAQLSRYTRVADWVMLTVPIGNVPEVTRQLGERIVATFGRTNSQTTFDVITTSSEGAANDAS